MPGAASMPGFQGLLKHMETRAQALQLGAVDAVRERGAAEIPETKKRMDAVRPDAASTVRQKGHSGVLRRKLDALRKNMVVRVWRRASNGQIYAALSWTGRYSGRARARGTAPGSGIKFRRRKKGGFSRFIKVAKVGMILHHGDKHNPGRKFMPFTKWSPKDQFLSERAIDNNIRRLQRQCDRDASVALGRVVKVIFTDVITTLGRL